MGTRLSATERLGLQSQQVSGGLSWGTRPGELDRLADTDWGHPRVWITRQVHGAKAGSQVSLGKWHHWLRVLIKHLRAMCQDVCSAAQTRSKGRAGAESWLLGDGKAQQACW